MLAAEEMDLPPPAFLFGPKGEFTKRLLIDVTQGGRSQCLIAHCGFGGERNSTDIGHDLCGGLCSIEDFNTAIEVGVGHVVFQKHIKHVHRPCRCGHVFGDPLVVGCPLDGIDQGRVGRDGLHGRRQTWPRFRR